RQQRAPRCAFSCAHFHARELYRTVEAVPRFLLSSGETTRSIGYPRTRKRECVAAQVIPPVHTGPNLGKYSAYPLRSNIRGCIGALNSDNSPADFPYSRKHELISLVRTREQSHPNADREKKPANAKQ
ncbi:hypothetical protein, partial [Nocardia sp. NPDC019302]|uniref:hypothetical protein n=1 Tax=Nocardia sp. NPDC019302 TaxID=3154592 RepID=UPI003407119F